MLVGEVVPKNCPHRVSPTRTLVIPSRWRARSTSPSEGIAHHSKPVCGLSPAISAALQTNPFQSFVPHPLALAPAGDVHLLVVQIPHERYLFPL